LDQVSAEKFTRPVPKLIASRHPSERWDDGRWVFAKSTRQEALLIRPRIILARVQKNFLLAPPAANPLKTSPFRA
jgi:hypothetical protein